MQTSDFHIDDHYMIIVGRYFETSLDFVNLIRVCKRYKNLVEMYRYNPIVDTSLFQNMQSFYVYDSGKFTLETYKEYTERGVAIFVFWMAEYHVMETLERKKLIDNCVVKRYKCPRVCHNWNRWDMDVKLGNMYMLQKSLFEKTKWIDSVTIDGVHKICEDCFKMSHVKYINLPKNVVTLEPGCFSFCTKLEQITLPRSLREIPERCFEGTALKELRIPHGVVKIGKNAFRSMKKIKDLYLSKTVREIDQTAFSDTAPKNIYCYDTSVYSLRSCNISCKTNITVYKDLFSFQMVRDTKKSAKASKNLAKSVANKQVIIIDV